MNAGEWVINWLYQEQLQVDPEWSVRTDGGFRWWPNQHAQTIEVVGQEEGPDGAMAYQISVQTDFLRGFQADDANKTALNLLVPPYTSMSGPVIEDESGKVSLRSLVRVHDGIRDWIGPIISMAAVLQIADAEALASEVLLEEIGAESDLSGHPDNGFRAEPDEMAHIVDNLIGPLGAQPCRWPAEEFDAAVEDYMQGPPSLLANGGGQGLTVEFPYGEMSSLCRFTSDEDHPIYQNGLLLIQSFPVGEVGDVEGSSLALAMNQLELQQGPSGCGFGGFHYDDGVLNHRCFLPNALYRPGLLPNLYFAAAERAHRMSSILMDTGWEDMWDENGQCRAKSSTERMMEVMGGDPNSKTREKQPVSSKAEVLMPVAMEEALARKLSLDQIVEFLSDQPGVTEVIDQRPIVMIVKFDDGSGIGVNGKGLDLLQPRTEP